MSPASTHRLSIAATTRLRCDGSIPWKRKQESMAFSIAASDSGVLEARGRGESGGGRGATRGGSEGRTAGSEEGASAVSAEEEAGAGAPATTFETLSAETAARGTEEGLKEEEAAAAGTSSSSCSSFLLSFEASAVARRTSALICVGEGGRMFFNKKKKGFSLVRVSLFVSSLFFSRFFLFKLLRAVGRPSLLLSCSFFVSISSMRHQNSEANDKERRDKTRTDLRPRAPG